MKNPDIVRVLPWSLVRPHPLNDKLYRPVKKDDPDVRALARSIALEGLLEPLVVTLDHFILSGHRRHVACGLAGLSEVRVRYENVHSADESRCLELLREYNRQRVKSFDEILREEIVSANANPEEAYRDLLEYRAREAAGRGESNFSLGAAKKRNRISAAKRPMLETARSVINRHRHLWPLSDRFVHYRMLNTPPLRHAKKPDSKYVNNLQCYKDLTDLLVRARLAGEIPWEAIHDPTRPVETWNLFESAAPFIRRELNAFLRGYRRNLQATQPIHLEIVGEKNTIGSIIRPVALEFCIPYTLGRGYSSLGPREAINRRFLASGKERLGLLVLSDFDPEGEDICRSLASSLRDDFGIDQDSILGIKVALTSAQVQQLELPHNLEVKTTSSRATKFIERHGTHVHELEAIETDQLQGILREAILSVLDIPAFEAAVAAEKQDATHLAGLRHRILEVIQQSGITTA